MEVNNLKKLKDSYKDIIQSVTHAGGRFLFIGGCVRDALLGGVIKDYDAEVYGLSPENLENILKDSGPVSFAGQSFGVYHLHHRDLEISIPRKDQKVGAGHRGFKISADPFLSFPEASRRRDLTMNSMGYDPITNELLDPWDGQKDMADKVLKATDSKVFGEDPLRALRVMQLSARFLMKPDQALLALCSQQDLSELPSERILTEFRKLLVKGQKPSWGFVFLKETGLLKYIDGLKDIKGSSWKILLEKLDFGVNHPDKNSVEFSFMLTLVAWSMPAKESVEAFLRYLKVSNHTYKEVTQGDDALHDLATLDGAYGWRRWAHNIHKGYTSFDTIKALVNLLMEDAMLIKLTQAVKDYDLDNPLKMMPIIQGKDLINQGITPGKEFTDILKRCHDHQLAAGCFDKSELLLFLQT